MKRTVSMVILALILYDGMYCYDVKNKEYCNLWETDNNSFLFASQGMQDNVYSKIIDYDILKVINFQFNKQ